MNNIVEKAKELDQFGNDFPDVEIGESVELGVIWDGTGDVPDGSFSIQITDSDWINYNFEVVEKNSDPLKAVVKITGIELL